MTEALTVLNLVLRMDGGGAERAVSILGPALRDADVDVATVAIDPALPGEVADIANTLTADRIRGVRRIALSFWRFRRLVREERPDIVHLHCETAELVGSLALLTLHQRPRIFVTEHTMNPWAGLKWLGFPVRFTLRRLSATLVSCFPESAPDGSPAIPNPVMPPPTANAGDFLTRPPGLVVLGRLAPNKRVDWVLEAAHLANWRKPITIIGDGPERSNLEQMAKTLGVAATFSGFHPDPWSLVQPEDVIVTASAYEGAPLAVLEAVAGGSPILASRIPGHTNILGVSHRGYFDTTSQLAERLESVEFPGSDELRPDASVRARLLAERGPVRIAQEWARIYASALDAGQPAV